VNCTKSIIKKKRMNKILGMKGLALRTYTIKNMSLIINARNRLITLTYLKGSKDMKAIINLMSISIINSLKLPYKVLKVTINSHQLSTNTSHNSINTTKNINFNSTLMAIISTINPYTMNISLNSIIRSNKRLSRTIACLKKLRRICSQSK
jgi:hypothetical protein